MLPARIVEFFPEDQTATIQICAETIFSSADSISDSKLREPLEGVPVHTVGGGGWHLTMPIKTGDTCIISFSQIGYDHWLYEDKDEGGLVANLPAPHLKRQFSEDDGFVTVGFNTIPRAIKRYSATDSAWVNDNVDHEAGEDFQAITLKEDLSIVIDSSVSVTINAPSVVVNCTTALVAAEETVDVTCDTASITAVTSVLIDTPETTITGTLEVQGEMNTKDINATGTIDATVDVLGGGVSLKTHTHGYIDSKGSSATPVPSNTNPPT